MNSLSEKTKTGNYSTRVECRFYIQDKHHKFASPEERQKYRESAFVSTNQTFTAETAKRILNDSFSEKSVGLRTVVFLQGLTSHFTLSKTAKEKEVFSPWYIVESPL